MGKDKRKIIAVIFSDEHLALWLKHNEGNRRLKDGLDTLRKIKLLCKVHKCPSLFLGDLFHKEDGISNKLMSYTLPYLSNLWGSGKFETYAISGNHDQSQYNLIDKPSPSYIDTFSKTFKGLHCMDFKQHDFGEWTISGIPYITHDLGLIETVKNFNTNPKKYNVLMIHTTMPGAKDSDGREVESNLKLNEFEKAIIKFDLVLCGHIHKPETYKLMTTDIVQVGSTKQQRLTDENCDMGYWLLYENYDIEFISLNKYPKFITLEPGKTAPDNKNFYVTRAKKLEVNTNQVTHDFSSKVDKVGLAKNYCKEKKVKNKKKKNALIKSLKTTE